MRRRRTRPNAEPSKVRPGSRDRRPRLALPKLRTAGAAVTAPAPAGRATSAAAVLASQVLRDGEAVLLVLRPSLWFIALTSLRWMGAGVAAVAGAGATGSHGAHYRTWVEVAVSVVAARVAWAAVQWTGRLYVLTDLRLLTLSGVTRVDVSDCPLRKVARTRLVRSTVDRLLGIGSIQIVPHDPDQPFAVWQQVARPVEVHEQIVATLNRARGGEG